MGRSCSITRLLRSLPLAALILGSTTACGLADTATSAAAGATSEVQQAREAKATEDRVKQQLDAAAQAEAQQREAAEKETQ